MSSPRAKVYLAGPGVFRADASAFGQLLLSACDVHGLVGLWPLDNEVERDAGGDRLRQANAIRLLNERQITIADAVIADLSPFRGPHMDCGTAYEVGFARALGKPVFAWSQDPRPLIGRMHRVLATEHGYTDTDGLAVENFDLGENLMIATAVDRIWRKPADAIKACAAALSERRRISA